MSELAYDPNTPRTYHDALTAAMFAEQIRGTKTVLSIAAGRTALAFDLCRMDNRPLVISLDPMYKNQPFSRRWEDRYVAGLAQTIPFVDESFDLTICHFGVQHMPPKTVPAAVREMLRVTKRAGFGPYRGNIMINPVFNGEVLEQELMAAGLSGSVAAVDWHDREAFPLVLRKDVFPSLAILKNDSLDDDVQDRLLQVIADTTALRRKRKSLGERISRLKGGTSYR
ncbi:MAG: ubiE/COQ5 methyltransferase family [Candidatus Saccharibacteria bacterium]|nr:ubiE/COQ5 methyltransferase family [Candidatus Saccharibacteria bacterium]